MSEILTIEEDGLQSIISLLTKQDSWVAVHGLDRTADSRETMIDYHNKRAYWQRTLATMPSFDLALLSEFVSEEISYRS